MWFNTLGNKTTYNVCYKYFFPIPTDIKPPRKKYGTETPPELGGINYDDANALITELILFIEDVDAENHEVISGTFGEVFRISLSPLEYNHD
ncbi:hypothetical protein NL418_014520 [Escherichia coli]|nr:hypothetical protein [Escherichia coli]WCQ51678.1 hypothetical protein NL418_014520 [Escherichia coli]